MNEEELKHNHIKEIAENYVNECWGSYLDLDEVDLVAAGIGVGKIIASEQEKRIEELEDRNAVIEQRIERAKECMRKLLFIINSDPANYNCKGLIRDAEDFIHNRTCNIRQQGQHCISETRCIMCDKKIKEND